MNLLEEFCNEIGLRVPCDIEDINYKVDMTEFNVVDGEEGDNGKIKYYAIDGDLLAVKTVYGGDSEEIEFTHWGKALLQEKALDVFYNNTENISMCN
tara:strand:+ start:3826 stop:4116 length:291 start_codon:yes stop_codon:yes gene_type:complete